MSNEYSHAQGFKLPRLLVQPARQLALLFLAGYLIIGRLWIFVSDQLLFGWVGDPDTNNYLQTLKETFFILVTGVALYLLVYRGTKAMQGFQMSLQRSNAELNLAQEQLHQQLQDLLAIQSMNQQSIERYKSLVLASAQLVWISNPEGQSAEITPSW